LGKTFGLDLDKDVVRRVLAAHYRPERRDDADGPSWLTLLGHTKDSLWSLELFRTESILLMSNWVLVVLDQFTRRIIGLGVQAVAVDGPALCRMFNQAIYVCDVLRRHGLPPVPRRKGLSWKQFLQSHLEVTWATDFFTEEVWTLGGLVTFYVLFFLHLGSRRVWIAGCTPQPSGAWMTQQARNFSMVVEDWALPCRYLVHDRDTSFLALDGVLKSNDLRILKTPPHSPLCNAYAERHVREIRETLDNLILLGEPQLRWALAEIQAHHNAQRPHQGIGNAVPVRFVYPAEPALPAEIQCQSALGGLLNHYSMKQAA
jgi:hypothetical protein